MAGEHIPEYHRASFDDRFIALLVGRSEVTSPFLFAGIPLTNPFVTHALVHYDPQVDTVNSTRVRNRRRGEDGDYIAQGHLRRRVMHWILDDTAHARQRNAGAA
jgi:hypothetical protein